MIKAVIFGLDGTLVQSEKLKARSYAIAVQRLRGLPEPDGRAVEAYRAIVGATRDIASRYIMDTLELEPDLAPLTAEHGVSEPVDVLSSMRVSIYDDMVSDPQLLRDNQWRQTVGLLRLARENFCRTGLATMSYRDEAMHVLRSLDLEDSLDVVLTREDVQKGRPDPEIYLLAAERLAVAPRACMVLEDSPTGVRAGVAAGMNVIAVATPFTEAGLHSDPVLEHAWIAHDSDTLVEVVQKRIDEHNRTTHGGA